MSKLSIVGALIGTLVIGCTKVEPLEPRLKDGIPPGPGLFTGPKGEWVLTPGDISTVNKYREHLTPLDCKQPISLSVPCEPKY